MSAPRYGCYNHAPYKPVVEVQGFKSWGGKVYPHVTRIPFTMSMDCNYQLTELGREDPKCEGCTHKDAKA